MPLRVLSVFFSIVVLSSCVATQNAPNNKTPSNPPQYHEESFSQWKQTFSQLALDRGITQMTVSQSVKSLQFLPKVIEYDQRQPEFSLSAARYIQQTITPSRINFGRQLLKDNAPRLTRISQQYGVPASMIVAIWGIESDYGRYTGNFNTLDALASLSYEGRRQQWAQNELINALQMIQNQYVKSSEMQGSWAGAMGDPQFIPSSYLSYAVSFEGNAAPNIWSNKADVWASIANYFAKNNWQSASPWGVLVTLPSQFDFAKADLNDKQSSESWARLGVQRPNKAKLPHYNQAAIILPAGAKGPAFMVGPNFDVILKYNNSINYALAVALLSEELNRTTPLKINWPAEEAPLRREEVVKLQESLNRLGFNAGQADGVIGTGTRLAIRAFQKAYGLPADGFVDRTLLEKITGKI